MWRKMWVKNILQLATVGVTIRMVQKHQQSNKALGLWQMLGISKGVSLQLTSGSGYQKRMEGASPVIQCFKSESFFDFGSVMDARRTSFYLKEHTQNNYYLYWYFFLMIEKIFSQEIQNCRNSLLRFLRAVLGNGKWSNLVFNQMIYLVFLWRVVLGESLFVPPCQSNYWN